MLHEKYVMGTCYYPEHWDRSLWESDLVRMLDAGITVVRIAEFAWSMFERTESNFTFDFFDDFLALCEKKGMRVIMGTPTATPPAWLTTKYPEVLNTDIYGHPFPHGGRRHYNYNSTIYRKLSARIVTQLGEHYGKHPAIIGWQLDNEFNCELSEYYSEADKAAFVKFLQDKYETLDALNDAWGTVFWNQTYTSWREVSLPARVPAWNNPHQMLDYYRFISFSTLSFAGMQAEILRKYIKEGDFITTNGLFWNMDNHKLMRDSLDIYMYDSYPSFAFGLNRAPWAEKGMKDRHWSQNLSEVRSVCPHFGIMEQQSGANGNVAGMEGPAPRPGQLTLWAMQSVAHGADFISFFRWRTACVGTEIYWHGILDYDNRDNRKLAEVKDFYAKLEKIGEVCGADFEAGFAVLTDYDNEWETSCDVWHRRVNQASRDGIFMFSQKKHIPMDYLYYHEGMTADDLAKYPVIICPHPVMTDESRVALLEEYARRGGTLIFGCRSGYKDLNGRCVMMPQPGLFAPLTGSDVKESTFLHENDKALTATFGEKHIFMPLFNDILEVRSKEEDGSLSALISARVDSLKEGAGTPGEAAKPAPLPARTPAPAKNAGIFEVEDLDAVFDESFGEETFSPFGDTPLPVREEDGKPNPGVGPKPLSQEPAEAAGKAQILATYDKGYYEGRGALTLHEFGKGKVLHLGSTFCENNLGAIFKYLGVESAPGKVAEVPEEVETVLRAKGGKKYLFLLNYSFKSQKVVLRRALRDLFSESEVSGTLDMKPFEVRVLGWEE